MINLIARLIPVKGQGIRPCKAQDPRAPRVKHSPLLFLPNHYQLTQEALASPV